MEEKDIIETENKGNKGNPYHKPAGSPDGGQFTASPEAGGVQETSPSSKKSVASFKQFLAKKGIMKQEETDGNKEEIADETPIAEVPLQGEQKEDNGNVNVETLTNEQIQELPKEEQEFVGAKKWLLTTKGIDVEAVKALTQKECVEVKKAFKLLTKEAETIDNAVAPYNKLATEGIWYNKTVYPSDYAELEKSGKIEAKKHYYEYDYAGTNKEEWLQKLDDFVAAGKKYEEVKAQAEKPFAEAKALVEKYKSKDDPYSDERRANTKIIDHGFIYLEVKKTKELLGQYQKDWENSLTPAERAAFDFYTGSYSIVTEPLRKINYEGDKGDENTFLKLTKAMDSAISRHPSDRDFVLKRGVYNMTVDNIAGDGWNLDEYTTQKQLDNLIGTSFKDHSFVSTGSSAHAKKAGMQDPPPVLLNIYCPKGIEMAYIDAFSGFDEENEMLINRGYTYTIRNAYKVGPNVVLDVDCILGSNSNKYTDAELIEIAKKYTHN